MGKIAIQLIAFFAVVGGAVFAALWFTILQPTYTVNINNTTTNDYGSATCGEAGASADEITDIMCSARSDREIELLAKPAAETENYRYVFTGWDCPDTNWCAGLDLTQPQLTLTVPKAEPLSITPQFRRDNLIRLTIEPSVPAAAGSVKPTVTDCTAANNCTASADGSTYTFQLRPEQSVPITLSTPKEGSNAHEFLMYECDEGTCPQQNLTDTSLNISANVTLKAVYELKAELIINAGDSAGSLINTMLPDDCDFVAGGRTRCLFDIDSSQEFSITAMVSDETAHRWDGWTCEGDCNTETSEETFERTLNNSITLTPNFDPILKATLTLPPEDSEGTRAVDNGTVAFGGCQQSDLEPDCIHGTDSLRQEQGWTARVTAAPTNTDEQRFRLRTWGCAPVSACPRDIDNRKDAITLTVGSDITLNPEFEEIPFAELTVINQQTEYGMIIPDCGTVENCGEFADPSWPAMLTVEIADDDYTFSHYTCQGSGCPASGEIQPDNDTAPFATTFNVTNDVTINGVFIPKPKLRIVFPSLPMGVSSSDICTVSGRDTCEAIIREQSVELNWTRALRQFITRGMRFQRWECTVSEGPAAQCGAIETGERMQTINTTALELVDTTIQLRQILGEIPMVRINIGSDPNGRVTGDCASGCDVATEQTDNRMSVLVAQPTNPRMFRFKRWLCTAPSGSQCPSNLEVERITVQVDPESLGTFNITPEFEPIPMARINIGQAQNGRVTGGCATGCMFPTQASDSRSQTLTATPSNPSMFRFKSWSCTGACPSGIQGSTNASLTVRVDAESMAVFTITPSFEPIPMARINIGTAQNGRVTGNCSSGCMFPTQASDSRSQTLTATPSDTNNYRFKSWSCSGACPSNIQGSTNSSLIVRVEAESKAVFTVTPIFEPIPKITVSVSSNNGGGVTGDCSTGCTRNEGWSTMLRAVPQSDDYEFIRWEGGNSNFVTISGANAIINFPSGQRTNQSVSLNAVFNEIPYYTISTSVGSGQGTVSCNPSCRVRRGTQVTVTADDARGWNFDTWSGDNNSSDEQITITVDREGISVAANFDRELERVLINAQNGSVSVRVTSGDANRCPNASSCYIYYGGSVELTASANSGYSFAGWSGASSSRSGSITIRDITSRTNITANFSRNAVVCGADDISSVNVSPTGDAGGVIYISFSYRIRCDRGAFKYQLRYDIFGGPDETWRSATQQMFGSHATVSVRRDGCNRFRGADYNGYVSVDGRGKLWEGRLQECTF